MFGYNAVEAAYPLHAYKQATEILAVLYLALTLSNIPAGLLAGMKSTKALIIFGPVGYFVFVYCLLGNNFLLALVSSIILGFTSAIYGICLRAIIFKEVYEGGWGFAFGAVNVMGVLGGGLGPYVLLKFHYESLLKFAAVLCLLSIVPLVLLYRVAQEESYEKSYEKLSLSSIKIDKNFAIYGVIAFCFAVHLAIVIAYIPVIGKEVVGEYRLFAYAIPSVLSLFGGLLYDRVGAVVIPIFSFLGLISFLNLQSNIIAWGFILTASFSVLSPGFQALMGRIVSKERIAVALGFVGFLSGIGVSLNIAVIGNLLAQAKVYLAVLIALGCFLSLYLVRTVS
jgi:hypothetical protein